MKRIVSASSLPVLALVLVIGIVCGKFLERQPTQAAQSAVEWEYCVIAGAEHVDKFPDRGYRAIIRYFRQDGTKVENGGLDPLSEGAIGKAAAKLGTDGWEIVSGPSSTDGLIYFKRPKK